MKRSVSFKFLVLSLSLIACGGGAPPAENPAATPGAPTASAAPAAPTASTAPASTPPAPAHADGMVTLRGKSSPIAKMELRQEDGLFYFYAGDQAREGVGIRLGSDLKVGAKIERDQDVSGHVMEDGSPVNVGNSSSFSFEVTKLELGTWEKPGKCSGRFAAEVNTPNFKIQASGAFTDIECFSISM